MKVKVEYLEEILLYYWANVLFTLMKFKIAIAVVT